MKVLLKENLMDVTITHVSYVKRPANKKKFFFAKNEAGLLQTDVRLIEKNEEERLLYGIVYEPGVEDAHGDIMTAAEIEKMAHEFVEYYGNIDHEHNLRSGAGVMVESYIAPADIPTSAGEIIRKGSWILVTRASEELWSLWKSGEITGYSMFGVARTVSKGESKLKKFISTVLEALGIKKDFSETAEATLNSIAKSPWFIMDMLTDEFLNTVSWDAEPDEQLVTLSEALTGAKVYVEGLLSKRVSKDEGEPAVTEDEPASEPESQPEPTAEQVEPEVVEDLNDEPETEDEQGLTAKVLNEVVETLSALSSKLGELEQRLAGVDAQFVALSESVNLIKTVFDENQTGSAVRTGGQVSKSKKPIVNSNPVPGEALM